MKTIIILLACIASLVGCDKKKSAIDRLAEYDIVIIDSCQYISYKTSYDYLNITHKGNCKYCRERQKGVCWRETTGVGKTSDQSLSAPAGSVKLGGTLTSNTKIESKWTNGTEIAPKKSELIK